MLAFKRINLSNQTRAYSLIELMVVLAIITILSLIGLPSLFNQDDRYVLNNNAEKIRQILADAQIRSLAPTKNDSQGTQIYQVDFGSFKYDAGIDDITSDTVYTSGNNYGTRNVTMSRGLAECSNGETKMGSSATTVRSLKLPKNLYIESFYPDVMTAAETESAVRFYVGKIGYKCGSTDNVSIDSADYYSDSRWKSSKAGVLSYAKYMVITIASTKISEKRYIVIDRLSSQISVTKEDPQAYIEPIEDNLPPVWRNLSTVGEQMYVNVQCLADGSGSKITVTYSRSDDWVGSSDSDLDKFPDKTRLVFYDIFLNTNSAADFPESSNKIIALKYFYPLIPDNNYVTFVFNTDAISISNQPEAFRIFIKTYDEAGNYNTSNTVGSTDPDGTGTDVGTGDNPPIDGPPSGSPIDEPVVWLDRLRKPFVRMFLGVEKILAKVVGEQTVAPAEAVPGTATGEFTNGGSWSCGNVITPTPIDGDGATTTYDDWHSQDSVYLPVVEP